MAKYAVAARNSMLTPLIALMNSGILRFYSGTKPTNADTALAGNTVLAELTLNATSSGAASSGSLTLNGITQDSSANNSGTCTFARLFQSDGTTVLCDYTVGTSGADINLSTLTITSGIAVSISSAVITLPLGT